MNKGESASSGEYFDFYEAIKRAEAEVRVVALWQTKMPEDWQAALAGK